jgi:hypothetical protein
MRRGKVLPDWYTLHTGAFRVNNRTNMRKVLGDDGNLALPGMSRTEKASEERRPRYSTTDLEHDLKELVLVVLNKAAMGHNPLCFETVAPGSFSLLRLEHQ